MYIFFFGFSNLLVTLNDHHKKLFTSSNLLVSLNDQHKNLLGESEGGFFPIFRRVRPPDPIQAHSYRIK